MKVGTFISIVFFFNEARWRIVMLLDICANQIERTFDCVERLTWLKPIVNLLKAVELYGPDIFE